MVYADFESILMLKISKIQMNLVQQNIKIMILEVMVIN